MARKRTGSVRGISGNPQEGTRVKKTRTFDLGDYPLTILDPPVPVAIVENVTVKLVQMANGNEFAFASMKKTSYQYYTIELDQATFSFRNSKGKLIHKWKLEQEIDIECGMVGRDVSYVEKVSNLFANTKSVTLTTTGGTWAEC